MIDSDWLPEGHISVSEEPPFTFAINKCSLCFGDGVMVQRPQVNILFNMSLEPASFLKEMSITLEYRNIIFSSNTWGYL